MNRRRVGLAAVVVGAGVVVWQQLKVRVNPDEDLATPETPSTFTSSSASTAPVTDVSLGDPEINAAGSTLGDPEIDMAGAPTSLGDPDIDTSTVSGEADVEPVSTSVTPTIIVPTMPSTGTDSTPEIAELPAIAELPDTDVPDTDLPDTDLPDTDLMALLMPTAASDTPLNATTASQTPAESALPATNSRGNAADRDITQDTAKITDDPRHGIAAHKKASFHRAHRGWAIALSILLGLVVTAIIAGTAIRLPYYSQEPGSVYDTIELVEAPGDLVSIPTGEIGFVTVAQTANISPWQWLNAKLDNNVRIRHEDDVRGDQTADELRAADVRRMQVSKNAAVVVALRKLGFELIVTPVGIEVAQVFDCTAADGTLGTGDMIVGVNGVEVLSGEELIEQLMGQSIGDEVDLLIERIDPDNPTQSMRTDSVALTLGSADAACLPDDVRAEDPRPFIGIGTLPMFDEEFPIEIDVRTGSVSGPSAGLAFTLAIMDVLSEGELTNGLSVVATGTIDRDGNVGPVGGIHQKTVTAERSGADVFLVPRCCDNFVDRDTGEPLDMPGNYEEALLYADDIIVIGVDTLDDALVALGELGGDVARFLPQETP